MGTTFRLSGVRLSSFRMCHINLQFKHLLFYYLFYVRIVFGIRLVTKVGLEEKVHLRVATTGLVTVNKRNIDTDYFIGEPS